MDTQPKSSSAKDSSATSTESQKIKYGKRGRPSNADKAKALEALAEAAKVTAAKNEKEKSVKPIEAKDADKPEKQKRKYTKKTDSKEPDSSEGPVESPVARKNPILLEKTDSIKVEEIQQGDGKIRVVTLLEFDYTRLKKIETVVKELLKGADKVSKYLGYGKNDKLPNTHEAQEGKGVKQLRDLVGMTKPGKGEPGDDVPF